MVGFHPLWDLNPLLFAMVMDMLINEITQESPWTMMLTDDTVICSERREQVEESFKRWRYSLERRWMEVGRSKKEYMCLNERDTGLKVNVQIDR